MSGAPGPDHEPWTLYTSPPLFALGGTFPFHLNCGRSVPPCFSALQRLRGANKVGTRVGINAGLVATTSRVGLHRRVHACSMPVLVACNGPRYKPPPNSPLRPLCSICPASILKECSLLALPSLSLLPWLAKSPVYVLSALLIRVWGSRRTTAWLLPTATTRATFLLACMPVSV